MIADAGKHRSSWVAAVVFGALALLAPALAPSAGASGTKKVKTSTGDLFVDADSVNGTISSKRDQCESGRKVRLRDSASGKVIGSDKTDKQGRWAVAIQLGVGSYYAEVEKANRNDEKTKLVCKGAKSKTVTI